jgi:hypothetical protein
MLQDCKDQALLKDLAARSVSCGRYRRFKYTHCGRCVPCQVRRAAFQAWGEPDTTVYKFAQLGNDDPEHANFDDVRSVSMAVAEAAANGLDTWLGAALSYPKMGDTTPLRELVDRGLKELAALHQHHHVK